MKSRKSGHHRSGPNLGGQIRHPELRATSATPGTDGAQAVRPSSTYESHDEDEEHDD
jgi:hypothetical protein